MIHTLNSPKSHPRESEHRSAFILGYTQAVKSTDTDPKSRVQIWTRNVRDRVTLSVTLASSTDMYVAYVADSACVDLALDWHGDCLLVVV